MKNNKIITQTFFRLLPVQIIIIAIGSINSIIDGMVATNLLGPLSLSACGLFFPIIKLMDTVNATLLGGSQILCSKYIGKNQIERSKSVFTIDMIAVVVFGGLISITCFVFCKPIANLIVKDPTMAQGLCDYMRGYAPGCIFYLLVSQLTAFLQIENQEKRTYIGMAMMILFNIASDIVFVSVFHMGLFGLGLATSLSNFVYVLVLISYYFTGRAGVCFQLSSINMKDFLPILKIGIPGAAMQFAQFIRGITLNVLMLKYAGEFGVTAFSAVNTFGCLFYATTAGVANATRVLCSVYAGEEDRKALKTVMEISIKRGVTMVAGVAVVLMFCSGFFTRMFYVPDAGLVYDMTRMGFLIFPITMPLSCICCVYINYYQCRNHLRIANILSVIDGMIGVLLSSFILAPIFSMTGIWIAHVINGLMCLVTIILFSTIMQKRLPKTIEDTMVLPESFGGSEEDRLDVCVQRMDEAINLSVGVVDFCKDHQVDSKRSMLAGLCIEEMVGNIVSYGFNDGKKHTIDVRVVYKAGTLLIRIKDDCKMFNPKAVQAVLDPEDITKNIGIRMISRMTRKVDYINSYGLNVLTLEV